MSQQLDTKLKSFSTLCKNLIVLFNIKSIYLKTMIMNHNGNYRQNIPGTEIVIDTVYSFIMLYFCKYKIINTSR